MMKVSKDTAMLEAARLTQGGKLREALDLIQRTLRGGQAASAPGAAAPSPLEGEYEILRNGAAARQGVARETPAHGPAPRSQTASGDTATAAVGAVPRARQWLRSLQRMPRARPTPVEEPLAEGAKFIGGSYSNAAGTRTYKLYVPGSYQGQALPLVVMLHGCTQDPDDFALGTRMNSCAERQPCLVLYPEQAQSANGSKCWNWFMAADQQRDRGEPAIIAGMTRQILDHYPVAAGQIYIAGLSAGGAMALVMAMAYPELYAAVGVHSGLPYAVAHDLPTGLALMGPNGKSAAGRSFSGQGTTKPVPAIVFHGDRDTTVHPHNAERVLAQCAPVGQQAKAAARKTSVRVERGQVPHGYAYTRTLHADHRGAAVAEQWLIHGAGHAWSGGSASGSYTDPQGPDATQEMLRFFAAQSAR